jgi:hypothetical protein
MGPAAYVIAILGCADGAAQCTPVATLPARYESEATCFAATGGALADGAAFDFPTIVAQCQPAGGVRAVGGRGAPRVTDSGRGG